eukprot:scaffold20934_cov116-Isochrysis_galbana.AAC.10
MGVQLPLASGPTPPFHIPPPHWSSVAARAGVRHRLLARGRGNPAGLYRRGAHVRSTAALSRGPTVPSASSGDGPAVSCAPSHPGPARILSGSWSSGASPCRTPATVASASAREKAPASSSRAPETDRHTAAASVATPAALAPTSAASLRSATARPARALTDWAVSWADRRTASMAGEPSGATAAAAAASSSSSSSLPACGAGPTAHSRRPPEWKE